MFPVHTGQGGAPCYQTWKILSFTRTVNRKYKLLDRCYDSKCNAPTTCRCATIELYSTHHFYELNRHVQYWTTPHLRSFLFVLSYTTSTQHSYWAILHPSRLNWASHHLWVELHPIPIELHPIFAELNPFSPIELRTISVLAITIEIHVELHPIPTDQHHISAKLHSISIEIHPISVEQHPIPFELYVHICWATIYL